MNCPSCKQKLNLDLRHVETAGAGVQCPRCERDWRSERVREIYRHCHEAMERQVNGIVNHLDFSDDCEEIKR